MYPHYDFPANRDDQSPVFEPRPYERPYTPERQRQRVLYIHTIVTIIRRRYIHVLDDLDDHDDYMPMRARYTPYRRPYNEGRAHEPVNADHRKDEGGFQKNARWN